MEVKHISSIFQRAVTWKRLLSHSPRRGMGSCFCVVSTFTIIIVAVVVNYWVRFHSSLEAISMKLGGYIGHGPNSSYPHF